jgi:hypothetical protein
MTKNTVSVQNVKKKKFFKISNLCISGECFTGDFVTKTGTTSAGSTSDGSNGSMEDGNDLESVETGVFGSEETGVFGFVETGVLGLTGFETGSFCVGVFGVSVVLEVVVFRRVSLTLLFSTKPFSLQVTAKRNKLECLSLTS